ncbi:DUF3488 and transglutaminase-like domain-containing protein [Mariniblastus sp.]|nr:DUF3488 and transglutaminase-like domain-containing protein [Mariniblastus sp.]
MPKAKLPLQINLLVMVILSGLLLGWSMESIAIMVVAIAGAILGFVICDRLELFRIEGALANVVTWGILLFVMWNFFSVDGQGKLVAVATMLTYLTSVLMFHRKTPRLIWQLLVLSLLQIVVGAIFSMDFEAGMLFLGYFFVVGLVLFQQSIFIQRFQIETQNIAAAKHAKRQFSPRRKVPSKTPASATKAKPIVFFDSNAQTPIKWKTLLGQLALWGFLTFAFATVLFHMAPRNNSPWRGPTRSISTATAGISKSVDLDERGEIQLSSQKMFRVNFKASNGRDFEPNNLPYFRGLALSNLVIRNGKTDFQAPYDRIDDEHYQALLSSSGKGTLIEQKFLVEASADPLLYDVYPVFKKNNTRGRTGTLRSISFCHEISGLTRKRLNQSIDVLPFEYSTMTYVDKSSRFYRSWPYLSNHRRRTQNPMSEDQPQHDWLTQFDPTRYRVLVNLSDQIAEKVKETGGGRVEFLKAVEGFFLGSGGFRYTLNYTDVRRNESLDPVEDFVRNHRSGHCEQFAAATTLMLRQQGIPARLVVGYHGGEFNALTDSFTVRASHAHAWVEAYLRPEDCDEEMIEAGAAGPGGAWMIVESTPPVNDAELRSTDEAIDLARTVWQDYVLGRDAEDTSVSGNSPVYGWMRNMDLELWEGRLRSAEEMTRQPWIKFLLLIAIAVVALLMLIRQISKNYTSEADGKKTKLLRRMVAGAVSLFSTQLAQWVMGDDDHRAVKFYQSLEKILADHQFIRRPNQSHLEFAGEVASSYSSHPKNDLIQSTIYEITGLFNAVRFGDEKIDPTLARQIDDSLEELQTTLQE